MSLKDGPLAEKSSFSPKPFESKPSPLPRLKDHEMLPATNLLDSMRRKKKF